MASEDHHFLSSSLYSTGMLVAWDPAPYSSDLNEVNTILFFLCRIRCRSPNDGLVARYDVIFAHKWEKC